MILPNDQSRATPPPFNPKLKNDMETTPTTRSPMDALTKLASVDLMAMLVILTACDKYVDACLADPEFTRRTLEKSAVSGEAWLAACRQVKEARAFDWMWPQVALPPKPPQS